MKKNTQAGAMSANSSAELKFQKAKALSLYRLVFVTDVGKKPDWFHRVTTIGQTEEKQFLINNFGGGVKGHASLEEGGP